jgi:CheY-like chemotaxis protein
MPRILIIDDDAAVRKTVSIVLAAKGFAVVEAESGKAGVEAIKDGAFDLVLVDLFMPGMDGLKTTEVIRQCNPAIPIIAASGFMFGGGPCPTMPNFDAMATEAGAVAILYKPFRPPELLQAIHKALGASE